MRVPRLGLGGGPDRLRLLVMAISNRCDQRCAHCQIWLGPDSPKAGLSLAERIAVIEEALRAGSEAFLLTGGEPLLSPHLWPLAERIKQAGATLMLATNGMLLEPNAEPLAALVDELYVSLDGATASSHDALRGVPAFARVRAGIAAVRARSGATRVVARATLHAGNLEEFSGIVAAARELGAHHVSFLPLDASSPAFGGDPGARQRLVPRPEQIRSFELAIERLRRGGVFTTGFILEPVAKLRRLADHLRASAGLAPFVRPECDAPRWSLVVEAGGNIRPCFFQPPVGDAHEGLETLRSSTRYREALAAIRGENPLCRRCVCPKRGAPMRHTTQVAS